MPPVVIFMILTYIYTSFRENNERLRKVTRSLSRGNVESVFTSDILQNSILEKWTLHKIQHAKMDSYKIQDEKINSTQNSIWENGVYTKFNMRKTDFLQNFILMHQKLKCIDIREWYIKEFAYKKVSVLSFFIPIIFNFNPVFKIYCMKFSLKKIIHKKKEKKMKFTKIGP